MLILWYNVRDKLSHKRDPHAAKRSRNMAKQDLKIEVAHLMLEDLHPNDKNPRQISSKQFKALKKSIQDFPEMLELREIVVDENNQILAGHQRYYALKDLGETGTVVKRVYGLSEKKKREFMAKDNNSNGQWDPNKVFGLFTQDELDEWNIDLPELDSPDFELHELDAEPKEKKAKMATCPNCGEEFEV